MLLFWIHSGAQSDFIAVVQALLFLLAGGTTEQCVTQFIGTTFDRTVLGIWDHTMFLTKPSKKCLLMFLVGSRFISVNDSPDEDLNTFCV